MDKDGEYVSAVLGRRDCSATEGEGTWISRQGGNFVDSILVNLPLQDLLFYLHALR